MEGILFGVVVSRLNEASWLPLSVLSLVLGVGWAWAGLAYGVGLLHGSSIPRAAAASVLGIVAAVISYDISDLSRGVYRAVDESDPHLTIYTDWQNFATTTGFWVVVAVLVGPVLGIAGLWGRGPGARAVISRLLIPVAALVEMAWRLDTEARLRPHSVALYTWSFVAVCASVAIIAVVVSGSVRTARRRRLG